MINYLKLSLALILGIYSAFSFATSKESINLQKIAYIEQCHALSSCSQNKASKKAANISRAASVDNAASPIDSRYNEQANFGYDFGEDEQHLS